MFSQRIEPFTRDDGATARGRIRISIQPEGSERILRTENATSSAES